MRIKQLILLPTLLFGILATHLFPLPELSWGATGASTQEYRLKAAFLVNFIRFISWPDSTFDNHPDEFNLCILGTNPFGNELEKVKTKRFRGRTLHVTYDIPVEDISTCQMLYISQTTRVERKNIFQQGENNTTVTVSDYGGFVDQGGSIEFVIRQDKLAFLINQSDLEQRGIHVSASMLDLAAGLR